MYKLKMPHSIKKTQSKWTFTDDATYSDKTQFGGERGRLRHYRPKRIVEATFDEKVLLIIYSQWRNKKINKTIILDPTK